MSKKTELIEFPDDEVAAEYVRRGLGDPTLDSVNNFDILQEFESRGLCENFLSNLSYEDLNEEMKSRNETIDYSSELIIMANTVVEAIQRKEFVSNRLDCLIEEIIGRKVCL